MKEENSSFWCALLLILMSVTLGFIFYINTLNLLLSFKVGLIILGGLLIIIWVMLENVEI